MECLWLNKVESSIMHDVVEIYKSRFKADIRVSIPTLRKRIRSGKYQVVVAINDRVVTAFMLVHSKGNVTHLDYLATHAKKGQGCGTVLVKELIDKKDGIITLECEDSLVGYYRRFGFDVVTSDYRFQDKRMNIMAYRWNGLRVPLMQVMTMLAVLNHVIVSLFVMTPLFARYFYSHIQVITYDPYVYNDRPR
jgi:hypothetical protein